MKTLMANTAIAAPVRHIMDDGASAIAEYLLVMESNPEAKTRGIIWENATEARNRVSRRASGTRISRSTFQMSSEPRPR